jgi:class 3 adenylate cyclase
MHVMFLDIIWFTTITEKLKPERALLLLNIYFDWIVEIIKSFDWYIDKFLGDGMLVVFTEKDSDNILKASIEIQKYIQNFRVSEIWRNISIWIWINSWNVIMWTVGSTKRMELTIIWDVVNTASRIEGLTRKYKDKIIISEESFNNIKNRSEFNINDLWKIVLKWKKIKKRIYGVESVINIELDNKNK